MYIKKDNTFGMSTMLKCEELALSAWADTRGENRPATPIYFPFAIINLVESPD